MTQISPGVPVPYRRTSLKFNGRKECVCLFRYARNNVFQLIKNGSPYCSPNKYSLELSPVHFVIIILLGLSNSTKLHSEVINVLQR